MTSAKVKREFVVRFAAGKESSAYSGVWRVWAAKKTPDLYLANRSLGGQVKATVRCPKPDAPTWKRHYGFVYNAQGEVADAVRADGTGRHKATWSGANLDEDITLEWRIFVLASALRRTPLPVGPEVALVPLPARNTCLIFAIILGPKVPTSGFPRFKEVNTNLLAQGRLSDGRRVWVTYCYIPTDEINLPPPSRSSPKFYGSEYALVNVKGELRASAISDNSDGSLVFWDLRVDLKIGFLKRLRIKLRHFLGSIFS